MARVVWIAWREDWSGAGVPVKVDRFRFLEDLLLLLPVVVLDAALAVVAGDGLWLALLLLVGLLLSSVDDWPSHCPSLPLSALEVFASSLMVIVTK